MLTMDYEIGKLEVTDQEYADVPDCAAERRRSKGASGSISAVVQLLIEM